MRIDSTYEKPQAHIGCLLELVPIEGGDIALLCSEHGEFIMDLTDKPDYDKNTDCISCNKPMIEYCPECEDSIPTRIGGFPLQ